MKIAIIGSKDFDSLEYHIQDSLEYLNYDVFHIDISDVVSVPYKYNYWGAKLFTGYGKYVFSKIADKVIEQKPDLVIVTYRFTHPDCISKIKKELKNTLVVHVNPDAITTFENQQIFASDYDAYFTKDPFIVDFMKNKMRLNAYYLPEALNARVHKSINVDRLELEKKIDIDVTMFGTMYPYRAKMASEVLNAGIDVALFGVQDRKFPRQEITKNFRNEFLVGDRKAEVLFGSKIVLNNFHYAEINSANVKYFEINGIGAFQLCDYKSVLEEYSFIDVEKYTYKSIDEAIEKIRYYLDHPSERFEISEKQSDYFHRNHTYEHRMKKMLKFLGYESV